MPKSNSLSDNSESKIVLNLLNAVDNNSAVTQRHLANDLGIALGLANAYLKRCAKKGLIKFQQIPTNRYSYYLTPKGFAEKSRLTAEYLSQSFHVYRRAKDEYSQLLAHSAGQGKSKIAVFGSSELCQIILICARDFPVELIGFVLNDDQINSVSGITVKNTVKDLGNFDVILIADLIDPQGTYENLINVIGRDKVMAPDFLNISPRRSTEYPLDYDE